MEFYFKIVYGFRADEYVECNQKELPKAYAIFLEGKGRAIINGTAIRGEDIKRIEEDWIKEMGWNKGYQMTPEDHDEIVPLRDKYREIKETAKQIAVYALKNNQRELLNNPKDALPFLSSNLLSGEVAEKMKSIGALK